MTVFKDNTTTRFTTLLPKSISLDGSWECGLVEIHFPMTLENVYGNNREIKIHSHCETKPNFIETGELCERIPSGHYESIGEIVLAINKALSSVDLEEKIVLTWETNRRVTIHSGPKVSLHVSSLLALQLGFEPGIDSVHQRKSIRKPDLLLGYPSQIYVYCDIVEQELIGDVVSPLLRIVSSNANLDNFGQDVVHVFSRPFYLPVMKREFETIEVDLRTHSGEPLPFLYGTSVIILHFRRSNGAHK
ncbi:hypothetical protein J437_LFUL004735 [Ladona fulva]|uniref:Uncharacterized protein n=1 Tax=Ladona fulva TaxID=123851 RepID=A0A8K0NYV7_LADFU|nr:hypothetical protein J437_LFUL004735 [Ladona fulva]